MKKFLVLGIGNAQVDLLKALKEKGFKTFACSNTDVGRGMEYVDEFSLVDITDKQAVLDYARQKEVDYIYSVGSDVAMPTVTWVAEKLNLPSFTSFNTANICNSKNAFREILAGKTFSVKSQEVFSSEDNISIETPYILKPTDSQGQRGVSIVSSKDEFAGKYEEAVKHSRTRSVIAEEYVDGLEVSVNAWMKDGSAVFYLLSDRITWPQFEGGLIHKHLIPSRFSEDKVIEERLKELVQGTCSELGIENGPVYFQIKIDQNQQPKLIEVTARLDGCHMWRLISHATGVNLMDMVISELSGTPYVINDFSVTDSWTTEFICKAPEDKFDHDEFMSHVNEHVVWAEPYYLTGDSIKKMNGKMEKSGYIIYKGELN